MHDKLGSAAFDAPHFTLMHKQGTDDCCCFYEHDGLNDRGERLVVELGFCLNYGGKGSMPAQWFKDGRVDHVFESWWRLNTYVYDKHNCYGAYNPTEMNWHGRPQRDGHVPYRRVIDFAWKLDATEENALRLLAECHRRFMAMEPTRQAPADYFEK